MKQSAIKKQRHLFPSLKTSRVVNTSGTFSDNLSLPVHRWFRFSAGFSALWIEKLIEEEKNNGRIRVLDPFCGSGTVLLEAETSNVQSIGIEAHPFISRIAKAKLLWWIDYRKFREYALAILKTARNLSGEMKSYPSLIERCYTKVSLKRLDTLRRAWLKTRDNSTLSELTWLALTTILRTCSSVGTAQWQYVLPNKAKAKVTDPYKAFEEKVHLMSYDMAVRQRSEHKYKARLYWEDARKCSYVPNDWAQLIVTSPPYANNFDYADSTRLEQSFWGEIVNWGDLQRVSRKYLIRSCTQHISKIKKETQSIINYPLLEPIRNELEVVCNKLNEEKEKHGGKKPYHTMIAAYFKDMVDMWQALRKVAAKDATVCFVIGDSAPYGIHVPVERWLGELAISGGFRNYRFEKIRARNVKWKNRKHRVPLHEGLLWLKG